MITKNEIEKSQYQNDQEYEDRIRLKIACENLFTLHSCVCKETFRTKDECQALTDVVIALNQLRGTFEQNHEKRKKQYYNDGYVCNHPEKL